MLLRDFIALTLDEVMEGVMQAALKHKESGGFGFINPMDGERNDEFGAIQRDSWKNLGSIEIQPQLGPLTPGNRHADENQHPFSASLAR